MIKTQPLSIHSRESAAFLFIILASASITVFYQADELFGAVGARAFYTIPAFVLATGYLLIVLVFLNWYKVIPVWLGIGLGILLLLTAIALNVYLLLVGWFIAILVYSLPFGAIIAGVCIIFLLWIWTNLRFSSFKYGLLRLSMLVLCLFMAPYLLGLGSLPEHSEFKFRGQTAFENKYYFLSVHSGWLGDPDNLVLYECNQFGFYCTEIYQELDYYWEKAIEFVAQPDKGSLLVRVDGNTLYTHQPKKGYFCCIYKRGVQGGTRLNPRK